MDRAAVLRLYDRDYAERYDARFLLAAWPKHCAEFELKLLRELLPTGATWLDVGCGTGWFLSQFPDVDRAGLDISPDMLQVAKEANPTARFLREGDFTEDVPEFHGAWSLVSCMWNAYCYLESVTEVERLVANMVRWTAPGGSVFIPAVQDLEDLRPHMQVPYEVTDTDIWGGRLAVTGYTWTWEEADGSLHENLIAVHPGHLVRLLEDHFEKVEVVRYPPFRPGDVSRKAVVATGRRPSGETGTAEVVWHPIPRHPDEVAAEQAADTTAAEGDGSLAHELGRLWHELGSLRGDIGQIHETIARALPPAPDGPVPLSSTSTRRLVVEAARRLNPLRPGLWRGLARRVRRRLPGGRS